MSELQPSYHLPENYEQDPAPALWGGVTDPRMHDPRRFRYLVHAINPLAMLSALTMQTYDARNGISHDPNTGDQSISMTHHPERVAGRVSLSMSLIDQDHSATWGEAGLIIGAPEPNVILTSETDAGAHNSNLPFLLEQAAEHGVKSGDELLAGTYARTYNEVVAVASYEGSELQLQGFFYKVTSSQQPRHPALARIMRGHAQRLGLPVVAIVEPGFYEQDLVDRRNDLLAVQIGGTRCNLVHADANVRFKVFDEVGAARFASPQQIAAALRFAINAGEMARPEAAKIAASYEAARIARETPTAKFDGDGKFLYIHYYEGYGDYEQRVTLDRGGYHRAIKTKEEAEAMDMAWVGSHHGHLLRYRAESVVSPTEADHIVERAVVHATPEQAATLTAWYDKARSGIEERWKPERMWYEAKSAHILHTILTGKLASNSGGACLAEFLDSQDDGTQLHS